MLLKRAGVNESQVPHLSRYVQALRERPAYRRAMAKVGKEAIAE